MRAERDANKASVADEDIGKELRDRGFAFVPAARMGGYLAAYGLSDWIGFAASWNDLGLDLYMADGGRYRRRRHAAFALGNAAIERKPHQPHYQSRDYNPLNGGIERWFEPITDAIGRHPAMQAVLRFALAVFEPLTPPPLRPPAWHAEVHQFRVEAHTGQPGLPTPEGMHRDGVDWVLVLLVARENVASGATTVLDEGRHAAGQFLLAAPMDAALVDDARMYHGVTPIAPLEATRAGYRDVLVVTLRR